PSDSIENTLDEIRENFGLALVVMTKGADGAVLVGPNLVINQLGVPAAVVDTVGAGDSFTASLTLGLLEARPLKEILRTACEFAARVCSHAGAVPED
ncbi:MAG: PfkB family carbohydrate kinase, partial [Opitutales bacterium]